VSEPVPIREGVVPSLDLEREMMDYLQTKLRQFKDSAGQPPTRIMLALGGKGENERFHTITNTWDARDEHTKSENCGLAVILFTQRALETD
jgi:hypothetical protein